MCIHHGVNISPLIRLWMSEAAGRDGVGTRSNVGVSHSNTETYKYVPTRWNEDLSIRAYKKITSVYRQTK